MSSIHVSTSATIIQAFKLIGIDVEASEERSAFTHPSRFVLGLVSEIFWITTMGAYSLQNYTNIANMAIFLIFAAECCLSTLKVSLIIIYNRRIRSLIVDMVELLEQANVNEMEAWHAASRSTNRISRLYLTSCLLAFTFYTMMPLPGILLRYRETGDLTLELPFKGLFPFDPYHNIWLYLLTYALFVIGIQFAVQSGIGVDSLFSWYTYSVSAHFRIVCAKLKTLTESFPLDHSNYEEYHAQIAPILAYHRRALYLAKEFAFVFGPVIFSEITSSVSIACFITYLAGSAPEMGDVPFLLAAYSVVGMQLVIYCFGGEKLQSECDMVTMSIYSSCDWERMSPRMMRLLLLPIMRSQRVCSLDAYFFIVDRNLLVWIFRTSFSFTALLFTVSGKSDIDN